MGAGLAQWFAVQIGHLVGTDHHGVGVLSRHGLGFGQSEAHGQVAWGFVGVRGLVYVGADHVKRHAQALQQFAAVFGGGAQNEGA